MAGGAPDFTGEHLKQVPGSFRPLLALAALPYLDPYGCGRGGHQQPLGDPGGKVDQVIHGGYTVRAIHAYSTMPDSRGVIKARNFAEVPNLDRGMIPDVDHQSDERRHRPGGL